ncbi:MULTISPECIES: methyl-accepting chemotaxis protein [Clostridium]|uniref:methyl-accepting chemotaxis protein n=1 Tax=Clostridium TaxID=1485 RepID=UPI0018AAE0BF|nr:MULTISPECIES: methyl-accepting chemotaxis protein [Clostridium]MBS5308096.1 methyl-accepting chemotaxis protein [Clostridium sp.]MDB1934097.1 methyl-accepting chemotaxis protein [Clostridium tertium]MDB1937028.1 methyl-accepting chemotaxis protein [Clostridium tertium]MDB1945653.1 methyl-accepting chemotaxis protein [Clostridium tertium]MDB1952693.1 methyl-accepting chemotaxis protein [Clostridium tertium]
MSKKSKRIKFEEKVNKDIEFRDSRKLKSSNKRRLTITQKILIFLITITLISSLSLAAYSSLISYRNEKARVNEVLEQTKGFGKSLISNMIVDLEDLIYSVEKGIKDKDRANSFIDSFMKNNLDVISIAVKNEKNEFIAYSGGLSRSYVDGLTFVQGGSMGVSWSNAIISGDKGFIVIKVNIDNKDYFLQVSTSMFQEQIDAINMDGIEVNLTDSFGTIMASNNKEKINTKLNDELSKIIEQNKEENEVKIGNNSKIFTYHKFTNDFKITSIYDKSSLNKSIITSIVYTLIITIIFSVVIILVASIIIKKYLNAIIDIYNMSKSMGEKDFTKRSKIDLDDEIGDVIRELNNSFGILTTVMKDNLSLSEVLNENTTKIDESSNEMYEASKQVATSIENISVVTQQQADSMVNISNNVNVLGDSIKEVSKTINVLNNLYSVLSTNAKSNNEGMQELLVDNSDLQKSIKDLSNDILDISASTNKINDFVNIIDDIANSINLISINASIEAVHAGEFGKGFAVVAKEINKLAENSKEATEIIKITTSDIHKKINRTVDILEQTRNVSIKESNSVKNTAESLKIISNEIMVMRSAIESIINSNDVVISKKEEILYIVESSAASMEEIAAATEEITAITEEQFSSTEEITNMAANLRELSKKMEESIGEFKV